MTAAVEIAVDFLSMEAGTSSAQERRAGRIGALSKQVDHLPGRADARDPLE